MDSLLKNHFIYPPEKFGKLYYKISERIKNKLINEKKQKIFYFSITKGVKMEQIIVLTGTIDPSISGADVKINKKEERLNQYIKNIKRIINETNFDVIIFGENSDYPYDYTKLRLEAEKNGKILEIIKFMGSNDKIRIKGKGYGEAEILNKVIDTSQFIREMKKTFYKITGRIFVKNVNKIIAESTKENYFHRWRASKNEVDTRFFKCSKEFYIKHIYGLVELMDDYSNNSIEEVYFKHLPRNSEIFTFKTYPVFTGICASLGKKYDLPFYKLILMKIQLQLGLLELKKIETSNKSR